MTTYAFPEFETADFTRLRIDQIQAHRVNAYIDHCLNDKEFRDLTMNHYGSYILGASKNLLYRSGELLTQLGRSQILSTHQPHNLSTGQNSNARNGPTTYASGGRKRGNIKN